MDTFAKPDYVPMFLNNITWLNDSLRQEAESKCKGYQPCLFDAAATNDVSIGQVTLDVNNILVDEANKLSK